jgi:uncharacterized protein (DUF2267 family)
MTLNFSRYALKANKLIKEVAVELGDEYNTDKASRVFRSVLHALRSRITIEESVELMAQLPMYVKAMYVDGWKVSKKQQRIRRINDFLDEVYMESSKMGFFDFPDDASILNAVIAVFRVLKSHVSEGEIEDIVSVLPKELKKLWSSEMLQGT